MHSPRLSNTGGYGYSLTKKRRGCVIKGPQEILKQGVANSPVPPYPVADPPDRPVTPMTEKELIAHFDKQTKKYKGDITKLEHAIGAFIVGRKMGWKPMLIIHDRKTIKLYEEIVGLQFKDHMEEEGPLAEKSHAWNIVKKMTNFWAVVKGEVAGVRSKEVT